MFKKNYDHLPKDVYFERSKLATPITLQALNPVVSVIFNIISKHDDGIGGLCFV